MRWVLVLLIVANIAYFVWQSWFVVPVAEDQSVPELATDDNAPRLLLLSELTEAPTPAAGEAPAQPEPAEIAGEPVDTVDSAPGTGLAEAAPAEAPSEAPEVAPEEAPEQAPAEAGEEVAQAPAEPVVSQQVALVEPAAGGAPTAEPVCWLVGPFPEEVTGKQVISRFKALELDMAMVSSETVDRQEYWVFLGPYPSQAEAFSSLKAVQADGLDAYVHASGELKNAVGLGYFSQKSSAESALEAIRAKGHAAEMTAKDHKITQLWGVLPVAASDQLSEEFWQELLSDFRGLERKQNLCSAIASSPVME